MPSVAIALPAGNIQHHNEAVADSRTEP
jgi:hypothetical protein